MDLPGSDKVSCLGAERLGQLGRLSVDDRLQLGERTRERLGRVGVLADGDLNDGQSERPDVGRDRVGTELIGVLSRDSFGLEAS